jgi:hypothetical protein
LEWQIAGFGDLSGNANETDMLMRNSNTGAFELFDISNNQITLAAVVGQVGLEWSIAGNQLTQAMAAFAPAASTAVIAPTNDGAAALQLTTPALATSTNGQMHPMS